MIPVDPFQLRIFCDSLKLFTGCHCARGGCSAQEFGVPTLYSGSGFAESQLGYFLQVLAAVWAGTFSSSPRESLLCRHSRVGLEGLKTELSQMHNLEMYSVQICV